ncbi:hypothetical protein BKA56DRAFT_652408 [Ilyonectria sp. MPI-CAGE-AT-0026]|nr:hypothetical protein BKA56DRAFT_652408 [Ilyonectria sp. MPI-CAGE-AT-0026]
MHVAHLAFFLAAAGSAFGRLHHAASCRGDRIDSPIGGTAWSVSYNWQTTYEIMVDATKCACRYYHARTAGHNCPDCTYNDSQLACTSAGGLIGGDEMNYYCEKKCGAKGSVAD